MCSKNTTKAIIVLVVEVIIIVGLYYVLSNLYRESPNWWAWLINIFTAMNLAGKGTKNIWKSDVSEDIS